MSIYAFNTLCVLKHTSLEVNYCWRLYFLLHRLAFCQIEDICPQMISAKYFLFKSKNLGSLGNLVFLTKFLIVTNRPRLKSQVLEADFFTKNMHVWVKTKMTLSRRVTTRYACSKFAFLDDCYSTFELISIHFFLC